MWSLAGFSLMIITFYAYYQFVKIYKIRVLHNQLTAPYQLEIAKLLQKYQITSKENQKINILEKALIMTDKMKEVSLYNTKNFRELESYLQIQLDNLIEKRYHKIEMDALKQIKEKEKINSRIIAKNTGYTIKQSEEILRELSKKYNWTKSKKHYHLAMQF